MNQLIQSLATIIILSSSISFEVAATERPESSSEPILSSQLDIRRQSTVAAQLPKIDVNWVVAIATVAATVGTLIGVVIAQKQAAKEALDKQKEALDKQVSKEVDAKIGNTLISLRELESEVKQQLGDLLKQLEEKKKQLTLDIESREKTLTEIVEKSSLQAKTIENLLERASALIPSIETAELIPYQLYLQAQLADNPSEKTILLSKVLEHPDSDSKTLELSGDLARQQLMNVGLARRLYKRSVELDPDNVSAQSEYLHLLAYSSLEREKAKEDIIDLARNNPNQTVVISNLMNFLIRINDYEGLEKIALELLDKSNEKSILWRNIAVARQSLGSPEDDIDRAYDAAFGCGDNDDFVNSARPYY